MLQTKKRWVKKLLCLSISLMPAKAEITKSNKSPIKILCTVQLTPLWGQIAFAIEIKGANISRLQFSCHKLGCRRQSNDVL